VKFLFKRISDVSFADSVSGKENLHGNVFWPDGGDYRAFDGVCVEGKIPVTSGLKTKISGLILKSGYFIIRYVLGDASIHVCQGKF